MWKLLNFRNTALSSKRNEPLDQFDENHSRGAGVHVGEIWWATVDVTCTKEIFICVRSFFRGRKRKKFLSRFRGVIWGWVVAGSHIPTRERKQKHRKEEIDIEWWWYLMSLICPQPLWDHCFLLSTYVCFEWVMKSEPMVLLIPYIPWNSS